MMDPINIALILNGDYALQAFVILKRIDFFSDNGRKTIVFLLYLDDASEEIKALFDRSNFSNIDLNFIIMKNSFSERDSMAFLNFPYMARLCLADVLPCDKVLYLDADVMIRGKIDALFDCDLLGNVAAAVRDKKINKMVSDHAVADFGFLFCRFRMDEYHDSMGIMSRGDYFNSGVLLIDLAEWRRKKILERCLSFLRTAVVLPFLDQDVLNYVIQGDVLLLGSEWNFIPSVNDSGDLSNSSEGPIVVHFAGYSKPWIPDGPTNDFLLEYWALAEESGVGEMIASSFFNDLKYKQKKGNDSDVSPKQAAVPSKLRPFNFCWTKFLPRGFVVILAEGLLSFGGSRMRRMGKELWNLSQEKQ